MYNNIKYTYNSYNTKLYEFKNNMVLGTEYNKYFQ